MTMASKSISTRSPRRLHWRWPIGSALLLLVSGCGKSEPEIPKEIQELQRKPDMYQAEVLGLKMDVPVGWTVEAKSSSARFLIPNRAPEDVVIDMTIAPYSAGETADSVVAAAMKSFDKSKGSFGHQELEQCRFPAVEEISNRSKKKNQNPNRFFYVIGTPTGKVTIVVDFRKTEFIPTYHKQLHYMACSIDLP